MREKLNKQNERARATFDREKKAEKRKGPRSSVEARCQTSGSFVVVVVCPYGPCPVPIIQVILDQLKEDHLLHIEVRHEVVAHHTNIVHENPKLPVGNLTKRSYWASGWETEESPVEMVNFQGYDSST